MAWTFSPVSGQQQQTPRSLRAVSKYLDLPLDIGASLNHDGAQAHAIYVGNPAGPDNDLQGYGPVRKHWLMRSQVPARRNKLPGKLMGSDAASFGSVVHIGRRAAEVFAPA